MCPVSRFVFVSVLFTQIACDSSSPRVETGQDESQRSEQAVLPPSDGSVSPDSAKALIEDTDFVDVATENSGVVLDMRYASPDNFVGKTLYPTGRCLLRRPVAEALARVQKKLAAQSLRLLLWDCYRPFSIQEMMWEQVPNSRYVAKPIRENGHPKRGSKHNRGAAVDLSLADQNGVALPMPSEHDDFSPKAHRGATKGVSAIARKNSQRLHKLMTSEGFTGIASEWWHFDFKDWQRFPLSERPFSD